MCIRDRHSLDWVQVFLTGTWKNEQQKYGYRTQKDRRKIERCYKNRKNMEPPIPDYDDFYKTFFKSEQAIFGKVNFEKASRKKIL